MNEVDLVILTPGHSMTVPYVKSFLDTMNELGKRGITWGWSSEYSSHVGDAREITLSGTRNNNPFNSAPFEGNVKYKKLIWIDSDIAWTPEDIIKLYESEKEIVCGAYILKGNLTSVFKETLGEMYTKEEIDELKDLTEVSGCGFGFIAISNGIFEMMSRPWFQSVPVILEHNNNKITFPIMGEDVSWCERARALGYKIWLDPSVKLKHYKTTELGW